MSLLDLLGTFGGAAFLAGAVALALRVDRLEAMGPGPDAAPCVSSPRRPASSVRGLRLVRDTDE